MRISTFGYVGKQGVKNIWRNVFTRIHSDDVSMYFPVWIVFLDTC